MIFTDDDARAVERVAADAWPAAEIVEHHGWRFRHAPLTGTRRVNSVWPNAWTEGPGLSARIAAAEAFYAGRGEPTRFQVCRAALPGDLDAELAARGYTVEAPTDIQVTETVGVAAAAMPQRLDLLDAANGDWLDVYAAGAEKHRGAGRRGIFERVPAPRAFALLRDDAGPVAVGLGIVGGTWCGVFCMQTRADVRGRGHGRRVLGGLALWAAGLGAFRMYLQLEQDNPRGRRFYERIGFSTVYAYHYRTLEYPR